MVCHACTSMVCHACTYVSVHGVMHVLLPEGHAILLIAVLDMHVLKA